MRLVHATTFWLPLPSLPATSSSTLEVVTICHSHNQSSVAWEERAVTLNGPVIMKHRFTVVGSHVPIIFPASAPITVTVPLMAPLESVGLLILTLIDFLVIEEAAQACTVDAILTCFGLVLPE